MTVVLNRATRQRTRFEVVYLGVKEVQGRQSFGIKPMLLEVALEGERGSRRRRKGPGPGQADR